MTEARRAAVERVDDAGAQAPLLVLVHGATQDRRVFGAQVPFFAPRLRLLLVDLPGHGASAGLPGPYDFETHAGAVAAAIGHETAGPFHYWGTHTGAGVGLMLAARMPGRVTSLVLEGAVLPDAPLPSVAASQAEAREAARRSGLPAARALWFDTAPFFQHMREHPRRCRAAQHRAIIDDFAGSLWLDDSAPRVQCFDLAAAAAVIPRTLLVNGAADLPEFLELAGRLEDTLPRARRVVIPDAGGFPLWEAPEVVNPAVMAFLEGG
jgi:pimeloyl-ACP methyl ester carboxylesterase